jgi:predicted nucleic acid-binding protein
VARAVRAQASGRARAEQTGIISFQAVQETLQALTRKSRVVATSEDTQDFLVNVLTPLRKVHPSTAIRTRALRIRSVRGFSFCDNLILATALESGCKRLLTEDLQHGQQVDGLRIENPFLG